MPSKTFLSGSSDEALAIANALGFGDFAVKSLTLNIDADKVITATAVVYPTEDQIKALGGELKKFKGFGTAIATIDFNYEVG